MAWGFQPDASRAAALSDEVNTRLISSLRYVFGEVGEHLNCDPGRVKAWIAALEAAPRPDPLVHVLFHSIVADVQAGEMEAAAAAAQRLLTLCAPAEGLSVLAADSDPAANRPINFFARFADIEEENRLDFTAPQGESIQSSTALVEDALRLIRANDAELDGELNGLLSQVLIIGQGEEQRFTTAALSCFQNWGAVLINPVVQRDVLDVVEALAHEATHMTLFALALDEPLLLNPPGSTYYSPLRQAPRSMDGVYHATVVSARVTRALLRQAEARDEDPEFRRLALERAVVATRYFYEGEEVIEANAFMSPLARTIFDECKAFMADARVVLAAAA